MIQIGRQQNPADTVTQHIYPVDRQQKKNLLLHLLQNVNMYSVLVFSRTKHGADKICRHLDKAGVSSVAIHSNRTQNQRQRALEGFRAGKYQVMVATDIAARGIDVDNISHVVNYDVPAYAEDYIHRIGRTGRAEATGDAITFVSRDEEQYLLKIEKYIGCKFKTEKCEGFSYNTSAMPSLKEPARDKKQSYTGRQKSGGTNAQAGKTKKYTKKFVNKDFTATNSASPKKKSRPAKFKNKTAKTGNKPYAAKKQDS
jgi:ATP-dependent RNA helicase RhlE